MILRSAATPEQDPYAPTHGSAAYRVSRYELELDYRVAANRLMAKARLVAVASERLERLEIDLGSALSVSKVLVSGRRPAKYSHRSGRLVVTLAAPVPVGEALEVQVHYSGNPRPMRSVWGNVGWEELTNGVLVASQPTGAPSWFPCNDHPSGKASYRVQITTDSPYAVLAPGELVSRTRRSSMTTWVFEQAEPMATYLATIHVGEYDTVELPSKRVTQRALVPAALRQNALHDFGRQDAMMRLFERTFGEYPFRDYSVVVTEDALEIPLEAQGMSTFGRNHVTGGRVEERLVAHELAHQWFGNCLTVERWQHIWLNEGFACYAEWLWAEEAGEESADALAGHHWRRLSALPQDIVLADPGPKDMFDDRVYKRGALTLHAIRLTFGDERFFEMLRTWVEGHRHGLVSTDLFVDHVRRYSESSLRALLDSWLWQKKLPALPRLGTTPR
ncbi:M1 family metallopeptidase [Actinomycetota bacterium]